MIEWYWVVLIVAYCVCTFMRLMHIIMVESIGEAFGWGAGSSTIGLIIAALLWPLWALFFAWNSVAAELPFPKKSDVSKVATTEGT